MTTIPTTIVDYARTRFGADVESIERLGSDGDAMHYGYGNVLRLHLHGGHYRDVVLHTARRGGCGHDTLADRAAEALLPWETFNHLPSHVHALDVGTIDEHGRMQSLGDVRNFFYVTAYGRGTPYFNDLQRIAREATATDEDFARVERLAHELARMHRAKREAPELWARRLRDLVGGHECITGLLDSYDGHFEQGGPSREVRRLIEHWAVDWRHRLMPRNERLCCVHGEFHPSNILFEGEGFGRKLTLLDRSRGEWGEAADDVAALAINYLFFSLRAGHDAHGPLRRLFEKFFASYLAETEDADLLHVIAPFFVWRLLVVGSPVWYPMLAPNVRARLFDVVGRVMHRDALDLRSLDPIFAPPS